MRPATPFGGPHLLQRLNREYDLRHPAIRTNKYLLGLGPGAVRQVVRDTPLVLQVHLFTYARLDSFRRLWASLNAADPPSPLMSVVVFVHHDHGGGSADHDAYLRGLRSRLGPVYIRKNLNRRGLRWNILEAGYPTHSDTFLLMLEDDIQVSK